jgi:hypothetical protein
MGLGRDHYILLNASSIRTRGHVCHDGRPSNTVLLSFVFSVSFFWFGFVSFYFRPLFRFIFYFFLLIIPFFVLIPEHLF